MAAPVVGVVGAKALRKDLNRLATEVSGPLYAAIKRAGLAAVAPVVPATRAEIPSDGSGVLAATVRASGTKTGGAVRMGRASVPYAGWFEFGGDRPDGSSRDYLPGGRALFPAARNDSERAAKAYSDALTKLFDSSGIWTNTTADGGQVHD
jgi:hypothetical protein